MKSDSDNYVLIFDLVKQIPIGKVTTYGIIAKLIGGKVSARVVGYALNKASLNQEIPAHRVVNRNGLLTGRHHFNPNTLMQKLLEQEGIKIEKHQIVNFQEVLWNPLLDENYL